MVPKLSLKAERELPRSVLSHVVASTESMACRAPAAAGTGGGGAATGAAAARQQQQQQQRWQRRQQ